MDTADFNLDDLIWSLVNDFIRKQKKSLNVKSMEEDLYQLAYAKALYAQSKYRHDKKTKLSSFIYLSVKRALMTKGAKLRRESLIEYCDELPESLVPAVNTIAQFEHDETMRSILSEDELYVFKRREDGYSLNEIAELPETKRRRLNRKEVQKCFHRILAKCKSVGLIQEKILTRRNLQDKWLKDTESSPNELSF